MHFRIVCLIKLVSAIRLDWVFPMILLIFCTSHVHAFFMHTFFLFIPFLSTCCVSFYSLSLSLKQTALCHPNNVNLLRLGTPFKVLGHPFLFHLTSGFVMRWLKRTSLRTFKPMVFFQNARSFCQILPTLLSLKSFRLGIELLYLRNPQYVSSCLFRSFSPTYMASIPLCLSLLPHSEVHVSQLLQILYLRYYVSLGQCIHDRLRTVSRDELIFHFCETLSIQGGKLNTSCSGFA